MFVYQVVQPFQYAITADSFKDAIKNPGNKPREPMISKNLFLAAIFLKGLEKVVTTHKTIATVIEIGCRRYESKSS